MPTPQARDWKGHNPTREGGLDLPGALQLLSTPQSRDGRGIPKDGFCGKSLPRDAERELSQGWGRYEPAIRRWEGLTRPAPEPTEIGDNGRPRVSVRFAEWMMGWPEGWVSDFLAPGRQRPTGGTLSRKASLTVIGNGVVPQQAAAALRLLKDSLDNERKENK